MPHDIARVRHTLKLRHLTVAEVITLTPRMLRIIFTGEDLADFVSQGADDHMKLMFPTAAGQTERRDYTPRAFDAARQRLTIDFALHEAGPATRWARAAKPGDTLEIGGPRGSLVVPQSFDWWLLVGDETALPAIGRRVEELGAGKQVISLVTVCDAGEEQQFTTQAQHRPIWVHRPASDAANPAPLLAALQQITLPPGDGFVFIAAEAKVARAARDYVTTTLGHPAVWMKAAGYWVQGEADAHEKFEG